MGLFNVIRLANDYNKAKKMLSSKKIDVEKIKGMVERIKSYLDYLYEMKDRLDEIIQHVKQMIKDLKSVGGN